MAKLTSKAREAIPTKDFAVAGRKFPIQDKAHARNALARASGKPVATEVRRAVEGKYPSMDVTKPHSGRPV